MTDEGEGKIFMSGANLKGVIDTEKDLDCPGHFKTILKQIVLDFESLKVELSGGSSWIY